MLRDDKSGGGVCRADVSLVFGIKVVQVIRTFSCCELSVRIVMIEMGRVNSVEMDAKRQFQSDHPRDVSSDEGVVWRNGFPKFEFSRISRD